MKIESLEMFSLCYYTIGNIPFHTLTYRHNGIKPRARDLSKMTFFFVKLPPNEFDNNNPGGRSQ